MIVVDLHSFGLSKYEAFGRHRDGRVFEAIDQRASGFEQRLGSLAVLVDEHAAASDQALVVGVQRQLVSCCFRPRSSRDEVENHRLVFHLCMLRL